MTTELEWPLGYFGPLQRTWVARNPPSFAFVEFEQPWDAGLDGRTLCGCPVRCQMVKKNKNRGPPPSQKVITLEVVIKGGVLHLAAYLQDGEALPQSEQVSW